LVYHNAKRLRGLPAIVAIIAAFGNNAVTATAMAARPTGAPYKFKRTIALLALPPAAMGCGRLYVY
jgi:hypothetical protein